MRRVITVRMLFAAAVLAVAGCAATISPFSPAAYEQATSLKVEALALMDKATGAYTAHAADVESLRMNLDKAYEYSRGRPRNEVSTKQWEILRDPERHSLGGFLRRWQAQGQLTRPFIAEAKAVVADGFDAIIELESGKRQADDKAGN